MIELKTKEEIEKLRYSNKIVAEILEYLKGQIKPGITGIDIDKLAIEECKKRAVKPAFLGLYGFPAAVCVSINEEVVHGVPKNRIIKEGDLVSIDFGVVVDGWYGDAAITVAVGEISDRKKRLLEGVEKALMAGIEQCYPGKNVKDISKAIEETLRSYKLAPICEYGGHGIGRKPHEEPHVSNCLFNSEDVVLKEGMVLAIEPMATLGSNKIRKLKDNWTVVTVDKSFAAHFEHSVAITENGPDILSKL
ncbi:type I methionyl aminopeptidase [Venenivibrio stagnispumantis]|uniref:Methionine aminopeptidase n=1 Tax=Venenivibrio stagnispumantis TaxID=407998 RepID=A0AA46AEB3_9AQUI|nr:type I methionyl aminopeptidase [Venenivibrio stagnispumantis]MCW4573295.1 type I methionyl aminopeptidase [Venenivibrio stagnispumantis]SMP11198.1 methionine aminopeptidase, type I [Venenivibrio stagnispumantis]